MKKYIIPLIALTALTGWGCEEEMVGGDWDYKDAMILVGQELIYAHNHTVELPAQQCSIDLQIVSEGISGQSSIDADHFGQNLPDAFSLAPDASSRGRDIRLHRRFLGRRTQRVAALHANHPDNRYGKPIYHPANHAVPPLDGKSSGRCRRHHHPAGRSEITNTDYEKDIRHTDCAVGTLELLL